MPAVTPPTRRTQQQRREETRQRLLDATIDCLVEHGFAGTTTQRVQERAGVSRGALLHHFASKADLLAAATHHVAELRLAHIRAETDGGAAHPEHGLALLRTAMSGPHFLAGLELWLAARTDPGLKAALLPAEREVGAAQRAVISDIFGPKVAAREDFAMFCESLLVLHRGLALTSVLREDPAFGDEMLRLWAERFLT
ncbi:TetR/AcrR family transcriptional regulator [Streptomyces sp. NPDC059153]|uniref:TetR/AcrR family transcriptional regulator n=1 Tax=unclassified Streptomyces TaxID=2593676 RepID=UPI00081DE459|nr:TetR/AcrR family transcriptional regulator [Streptomyces sp. Ncost-T10-10d]SCF75902.1 transcriptional regulator, TetR family [Streptomyces sp. Ncost-T10-10d]